MTVPTETAIALLAWTGFETSFVAGFRAQADDAVAVYAQDPAGNQVPLTRNTHFAVARDGNGAVTVTPIALPTAPQVLIIFRITPAVQGVDFANLGAFTPAVHTALADAAAMRDAELRRDLARTLRVPLGESAATVPGALARSNAGVGTLLGFDVAGAIALYDAELLAGPGGGGGGAALAKQIVTLAGTTGILTMTQLLVFNKPALSDSPCNLPSGLARDEVELIISDFTGLAGDIVLTPYGTEKIMGANAPWTISSGGVAQAGGRGRLMFLTALPGWIVI